MISQRRPVATQRVFPVTDAAAERVFSVISQRRPVATQRVFSVITHFSDGSAAHAAGQWSPSGGMQRAFSVIFHFSGGMQWVFSVITQVAKFAAADESAQKLDHQEADEPS